MNTQYGGSNTTFFQMILYLVLVSAAGYYTYRHFSDESSVKRIVYTTGACLGMFLIIYILNMFKLSY